MPAIAVPKLAAATKARAMTAYTGPPTVRSHSEGSEDLRTSTPAMPIMLRSGTGAPMPSITGTAAVLALGGMRTPQRHAYGARAAVGPHAYHRADVGPPRQERRNADLHAGGVVPAGIGTRQD